jgi:poly-gamma-glutamate synthesis protein (capsule biosynthesis protein)
MATDQTADQRSPRTVRRALVALGTVLTLGAVLLVEQRSSGPAGAEDMKDTPGERAGGGDGGTVRAGGADEGPRGAVTIALAGDVHLEGVLAELDDQSGSTLGPMSRALSTADVAVVNLESAISDGSLPMAAKELEDPGNRYWFSASPSVLGLMERSGVDAVSLANNHGADYGRAGLRAALAAAEGSPVGVVGVGRTPEEAYAPYRTSVRGTDIAVLAADASPRESAERTWAIGPGTGVGMAAARRPDAPALLAAVRDAAARDDVTGARSCRSRPRPTSGPSPRASPRPAPTWSSVRTPTSCRVRGCSATPTSATGWATSPGTTAASPRPASCA